MRMEFEIELGTIKAGEETKFSYQLPKNVKTASGSCGCISIKFSGSMLTGVIIPYKQPSGTKTTKKVNGTYEGGGQFTITLKYTLV